MNHAVATCLFFATWIALAIGGLVFALVGTPKQKRSAQRWMPGAVGILFLGFAYAMDGIRTVLFLAIPIALITYLNTKNVRYCLNCGKMNYNPNLFPPPKFCQRCGKDLDAAPDRPAAPVP